MSQTNDSHRENSNVINSKDVDTLTQFLTIWRVAKVVGAAGWSANDGRVSEHGLDAGNQ